MALIRDVTAKEREIHSSIIVLLDVRKEATMCIIPVVPISKFTRILTSTGKLFAGEGSLQNNWGTDICSRLTSASLSNVPSFAKLLVDIRGYVAPQHRYVSFP